MQTVAVVEVTFEEVQVRPHFGITNYAAVVVDAGSGLLRPHPLPTDADASNRDIDTVHVFVARRIAVASANLSPCCTFEYQIHCLRVGVIL